MNEPEPKEIFYRTNLDNGPLEIIMPGSLTADDLKYMEEYFALLLKQSHHRALSQP